MEMGMDMEKYQIKINQKFQRKMEMEMGMDMEKYQMEKNPNIQRKMVKDMAMENFVIKNYLNIQIFLFKYILHLYN